MPSPKTYLMLIILLAIFFRFWDFKNVPPGLWSDEAINGNNAAEESLKVFYPENFGREGLFINIQSLFVATFGNEPWVLRLPSAIFGVLTALGLCLMTRELFNKRVALFAAFFLATSFWHIMFSRIGFRAIMAPFFLVWSFYFLFKGISDANDTNSHANATKVTLLFALAGLTFGLGFHTYIAYRIAPLIAIYPFWKFYQNWQLRRPTSKYCAPCLIGLFIFMAFVAAIPLLWYYAQNPADFFGRTAAISIFQTEAPLAQFSENLVKTLGMFNFVGDFNWRHNLAGSPQLWWPVGILFLIGVWLSLKKLKWPKSFILLWFVIMLLPVALSNESLPHALRSIVLIPPVMIFVAIGLEYFIGQVGLRRTEDNNPTPSSPSPWGRGFGGGVAAFSFRPQFVVALLFTFFLAVTVHTYNTYFLRWAPNFKVYQAFQTDLTEKAQWLKKDPQDLTAGPSAGRAGKASIKKYVVTDAVDYVDTRGTPMSFQPIIFIAGAKNIEYLGKSEFDKIDCPEQCIIVPVESRPTIYKTLKQKIPGLRLDASSGFVILRK